LGAIFAQIFRDFWQIKTFGGVLAPPLTTPLPEPSDGLKNSVAYPLAGTEIPPNFESSTNNCQVNQALGV